MTAQPIPTRITRRRLDPGQFLIHVVLLAISLVFMLPLVLVISASFTDEIALARNGYSLIPSQWSSSVSNRSTGDEYRTENA